MTILTEVQANVSQITGERYKMALSVVIGIVIKIIYFINGLYVLIIIILR